MKNIIRQLQTAMTKAKAGATDFCPHSLASITFPSGRTETFAPCYQCTLPPLAAILNYQDGRTTPRTAKAARAALAESAKLFSHIPEAERRAGIAKAFCVDETLL